MGAILGIFLCSHHIAAESYPLPMLDATIANPTYYHCFLLGRCYQIGMVDAILQKKLDFNPFLKSPSFLDPYRGYPDLIKEFEHTYETGYLAGARLH
jgi:hypothetical protein